MFAYLSWHGNWWTNLGSHTLPGLSDSYQEGSSAYAHKQVNYWLVLHSKFDALCEDAPRLSHTGIGSDNAILNLNAAACGYLVDTPSTDITNG